MKQAVLPGRSSRPGFARGAGASPPVPAGEVDSAGLAVGRSEKEFKAMLLAIRAGLMSPLGSHLGFGYDAEDVDREIAADNQRADDLGLVSIPTRAARPRTAAAGRNRNGRAGIRRNADCLKDL